MRHTIITTAIVSLLFSACNSDNKTSDATSATASDSAATTATTGAPTAAPPMDTAAMRKAWEDFAKPGDMHKWMATLNGTWDGDITSYENPAQPQKSKAICVYNSSLNGLYQEGKMKGTMMGMPFEGRSTMGYDNAKKKFVSTWIDNMGSGIVYMTGTYDDASKTLNLKGSQTDPTTGKDMDIREVMKVNDDKNYTLEMYGTGPDGKEMKFMDMVCKRKK